MAVSSTSDFIMTRNQILNAVLRKVTGARDGWDAEEIENAAEALNLVVKSLQNHSVLLWKCDWITKTLSAPSEITGSDGLNYTCRRSHTSSASNKPITGADWSTYWEQAGTNGVAWVTDTAYSSIGEVTFDADVVGIQHAFRRYPGNTEDNPIEIIPWLDYLKIGNKEQTGDPLKIALRRDINGISRGFMWPQPDNTDYVIHLEAVKKLKDFDTDSNNPDFPVRWYKYLIYQTAYDLSPEYSVSKEKRDGFKADANEQFMLSRKPEFENTDDNFVEPI